MKNFADKLSLFLFAAALMLCACFAHGQVSVAQAPPLHFQFLDANGEPLGNGKIFTYAAGSTTLQYTYIDATGTTQNQDPILLDASGSPTNGSSPTNIFLANASYKFVAYNSQGVFQWSVDNIAGYFSPLLSQVNTWSGSENFLNTTYFFATDNQLVMGAGLNQTILDFPPPAGFVTLHFPTTTDTMVGRATTDTLTNKSLTNPTVNGVAITQGPGTYALLPNSASAPPFQGLLTKLVTSAGISQAALAATTDTSGIIGICASNCTNTGSSSVQQSGTASCLFDGASTAGDYIQISSTTAGNCHDAGASYPVFGQVIGRVLSTNGGSGFQIMDLFGPEIRPNLTGGTPTGALGTGAGGGSPSFSFAGNSRDKMGQINVTTGTAPPTGVVFTLTFSAAFPTISFCTFSPVNANAVAASVDISTAQPGIFQLLSTSALTAATAYSWSYQCGGF